MDETTFQDWSQALSTLREKRQSLVANLRHARGPSYTIKEFIDVAKESLQEAASTWWGFESRSRESGADGGDAASLTEEVNSVVDFEVDAITRDLESFEGAAAWDQKTVSDEMANLSATADEIKQSYMLKIRSALGVARSVEVEVPAPPKPTGPTASNAPSTPSPRAKQPAPVKPRQVAASRSGGSGVALFVMFVVGILLGAGPSFYFWDVSQKSQVSGQDQVARLTSEKRALEDNLAIYQQNLTQLASGKMMTLPQLESQMKPIQSEMESRRKKIDRDFTAKRESLLRRTPAGDLQDRALEKLGRNREEGLASIDAEKTRLEPYRKQLQILKELADR